MSGSCDMSEEPMTTVIVGGDVVDEILIGIQFRVTIPKTILSKIILGVEFGIVVKVVHEGGLGIRYIELSRRPIWDTNLPQSWALSRRVIDQQV